MHSASTSITSLATVIDLAISLEKHGRDFYANARDRTTDHKCREFFSWLVVEEENHHKTYLDLQKNKMGGTQDLEELPGGYGRFVELLVKEVTESLTLSEELSVQKAIDNALFFEESVVRYFEKVKTLFSAEQSKIIEGICEEEQKHIDAILRYKAELAAS